MTTRYDLAAFDIADTCRRLGRVDLIDAAIAAQWGTVGRELATMPASDVTRHEQRAAATAAMLLDIGSVDGAARTMAALRDDEMPLVAYDLEVGAEMAAAVAS